MNQQPASPKQTKPIIWAIFAIVALSVAGGIWYVVAQGNENTNTKNSINNANSTAQNTNRANTNVNGPVNNNPDALPVSSHPDYVATANGLLYRNDKFGYGLTIPNEYSENTAQYHSVLRSNNSIVVPGKLGIEHAFSVVHGQEDLFTIQAYPVVNESYVLTEYQSYLTGDTMTINGVTAYKAKRARDTFDDLIIRRGPYFFYIHSDHTDQDRRNSPEYQDYLSILNSLTFTEAVNS